jgi:excisionase family DNA binding protein
MKKKTKPADAARKPYTVRQAAAFLSLSTNTIRGLIKSGTLRASRICPRKILIPAEDVEKLVDTTC